MTDPEPTHAAPATPPDAPVPSTGGMRQLTAEDFSLEAAVGGTRGVIESIAPGLVFVVVFVATHRIAPATTAALAVALAAVVARLLSRSPLTQALSGVLGVVIGVVWAWRSGEAENFFAWGLLTNAAYALGVLVSILIRWPLVGVVVGALRGEGTAWRREPHHLRRYTIASWFWFGLFGARLAVQLPLFLSARVEWLGTARLVMGVPLWALTLWATWVVVRETAGSAARPTPRRSAPR